MATDAKHTGLSSYKKAFTLSRKSNKFIPDQRVLAPFDGKVIVLFGPLLVVRDLIYNMVQQQPVLFTDIISHTTRPPNPDEIDGLDYFFVKREDMSIDARNGEFIEIHFLGDGNDMIGISYTAFEYATKTGAENILVSTDVEGMKGLHSAGFEAYYIHITDGSDYDDIPDSYYAKRLAIEPNLYNEVLQLAMEVSESENANGELPLAQAISEWDAVTEAQSGNNGEELARTQNQALLMSFEDALNFAKQQNLEIYAKNIKSTIPRGGFAAILRSVVGPPKLSKHLHEERDFVFILAQWPFDNEMPEHFWILQTIYKKLTNVSHNCQRYGNHWQDIGFQGSDPSTDLRGCGFLGLLTTLYFVTNPELGRLTKDIYRLSQHETQNFPFCAMSINMSRVAMHALREEMLTRECNRNGNVINVFCEFYAAVFYYMYQLWKKQKKTIADAGFLINDVSTSAKKNPAKILKKFRTAVKLLSDDHRQLPEVPGRLNAMPDVYGIQYQTGSFQEREVVARDTTSISASSEDNEVRDDEQQEDDAAHENQVSSEVVQIEHQGRKSTVDDFRVKGTDITSNTQHYVKSEVISDPLSLSKTHSVVSNISDSSSSDSQDDHYKPEVNNLKNYDGSDNIHRVSSGREALDVTETASNPRSVHIKDQSLSDIGVVIREDDPGKVDSQDSLKFSHASKTLINGSDKVNDKSMEDKRKTSNPGYNNTDRNFMNAISYRNGSSKIQYESEHAVDTNNVEDYTGKGSQYSANGAINSRYTETVPSTDNHAVTVHKKSEMKTPMNGADIKYSESSKSEMSRSNNSSISDMTKYAIAPEFNGSRENSFDIDPNVEITLQVDSNIDSYSSSDSNNWDKSPTHLLRGSSTDYNTVAESTSIKANQSIIEKRVYNNEEDIDDIEYLDDDCV